MLTRPQDARPRPKAEALGGKAETKAINFGLKAKANLPRPRSSLLAGAVLR